MPTRQQIGLALQGFGEGFHGRGAQFQAGQQTLAENRKQALLEDAFRIQKLLQSGDVPGAQDLILNRFDNIRQLGGDPADTKALLDKLDRGDVQGALGDVTTVVEHGFLTGRLEDKSRDSARTQFSSTKKVIGTTRDGKKINGSVTQRLNPNTGKVESGFQPDVGDVDPNDPIVSTQNVGTLGLTGKEQIDERQKDRIELARVQTAELAEREIAKTTIKRNQGFIDEAISVGDELPEMKRALTLLQSVKTGGFAAAAIKAKQFFGIEAADEGELSAKLGVAVMARLRATFGAQFTEREGDRLDKASARMGANTATNMRLLETTIKRMEREMRRGLKFATKFEDQDALDIINDALEFTFDGTAAAPPANDPRKLPGFGDLSPEDQDELLQRAGAL